MEIELAKVATDHLPGTGTETSGRLQSFEALLTGFRPKIEFERRVGHYLVKTALDEAEMRKSLRLRHPETDSCDIADLNSDHLLVIDQRTARVIATARLTSSLFATVFPAAREFELHAFLNAPGAKLECGFLTVDAGYRGEGVVRLLMRGLADYVKLSRTRYVFACLPAHLFENHATSILMKHLERSGAAELRFAIEGRARGEPGANIVGLRVSAVAKFADRPENGAKETAPLNRLPSILKLLIRLGAKFAFASADDKERLCTSQLSILDTEKNETLRRFGL